MKLTKTDMTVEDLYELVSSSVNSTWPKIADAIKRNVRPETGHIAQALRGNAPIPDEVRCYLADLIEFGPPRRPAKRPTDPDHHDLMVYFADAVDWLEKCAVADNRKHPRKFAFEEAARQFGLSSTQGARVRYGAAATIRLRRASDGKYKNNSAT